eukprot:CAMPEP_0185710788 /NCGR_PEP_ID=MMETSP1164-20130828/31504_1 /TAXON_ID=1104430 /ORGANISM="Chrysoreinhardia sp, Strain CCMP2950" /LENGTH=55 /DNA_ID=CAMNT_0028378315 /DNA_START=146 /DNA_END=310 /DNA_ORIENTATION=+
MAAPPHDVREKTRQDAALPGASDAAAAAAAAAIPGCLGCRDHPAGRPPPGDAARP